MAPLYSDSSNAKKSLRRWNVGLIKEWVAVKQDPLEPLSIDYLEQQVVVRNPVEKKNSKTLDVELSTQVAEEELIVRVIEVSVEEMSDSLVMQQ
jgi:hypothetical protein